MRTVVGYVPNGFLNASASASSTGSSDVVTGLPIATGLNVGDFYEIGDGTALGYSKTSVATLYSGVYMWVQLDPAVSGTVARGVPLYWLQTATGLVVTNVATANTNNPDFAGVNIDPTFGAALPYAFIQMNGKCSCLFDASQAPTYGATVNTTAAAATFAALATTVLTTTQATVGYALSAGSASTVQLVRITRYPSRY